MPKGEKLTIIPEHVMREAVQKVLEGGWSTQRAAKYFNIPRTTLRRYVTKCRRQMENIDFNEAKHPRLTPNYACHQIFTSAEEKELSSYIKHLANLHHGFTPTQVKSFAYDLATFYKKKVPECWETNKSAGSKWFNGFMKRNPTLSLRVPEATSLARAMGFNKPVVDKFFKNLSDIYLSRKLGPDQIYNVDETALTTVQSTNKVVATLGQKQVGQITSAERGTLVTMIGAINAIGNSVPPLLVFPRKNFKQHMLVGAPPGSEGAANPSGWSSKEIFLQWLNHFIKHAGPTENRPVLLIMDNHDTHISLEVIEIAKSNNVILLTFPPHTSHKLQPLDVSVFGPLKKYYNKECGVWIANHPGKRIDIYNIAEILGQSYGQAFCTQNIVSAFKSTGIYPLNKNCFKEHEFLPASVTDIPLEPQPAPINIPFEPQPSTSQSTNETLPTIVQGDEISTEGDEEGALYFSPELVRPFPKAERQVQSKRGRKKRATEILTSTPNIQKLKDELDEKLKSKVTKKLPLASPSSSENEDQSEQEISFASSTLTENFDEEEDDDRPLEVSSFVLVRFATTKTIKYFVGQIKEVLPDEEYKVSFLRKYREKKFVFPNVDDVSVIQRADIVLHLPEPKNTGGTLRTARCFFFDIDLDPYNIN